MNPEPNDEIDTDKEFANQLRQTNSQQFVTLVRMHLLQKIDLQTLEQLEEKKLKKNGKNKRANKSSFTSKNVHSFDEEDPMAETTIVKLQQLITFIVRDDNVCQEGVFRKTGSVARQNELKRLLHQSEDLVLDNYTVHDCASVLKSYLADLPEPLLTETYQPAYQQISEMCSSGDWNDSLEERAIVCLQLLFHLLPEKNRTLLEEINVMLHRTAQHESSNKMNSTSLATLFAPHLICPKHLSAEALHGLALKMTPTISLMIQQGGTISKIPKELATDIRVFLFDQKRRENMSPETTAHTVFTFCDRQKTAEENTQNQTDAALASLYAHIQGLPESSKKKKLIKQFKENGHGTPPM
jgi:Rho GTPase-activating protein 19